MTKLSTERRNVVVLCALAACMAGGPVLLKGHPVLIVGWIVLQIVILVLALTRFAKLQRGTR